MANAPNCERMSYFAAGLWHCAAALAFAATFGIFASDDPFFLLDNPFFTVPLVLGSSALFFVPDAWSKKGPLKFLHYPLPDWDVLLLGPASHRNWLTHSALLPILLCVGNYYFPEWWISWPQLNFLSAGLCIGIASHLFWDCVGSRSHKIIVVPYWFHMREAMSRVYLLSGTAIALGCSVAFIRPQNGLLQWLQKTLAG